MAKKKATRTAGTKKKAVKTGKKAKGAVATKKAATRKSATKKVGQATRLKKTVKKTAAKVAPRAKTAKRAVTRKAPRRAAVPKTPAPRPRPVGPPISAPIEIEPMPPHEEHEVLAAPVLGGFGDFEPPQEGLHEEDEEEGGDEQGESAGPAVLRGGDEAPDFELPDERGELHRLSDYRGQQVVVYFYPRDDTPGCTMEACGFRDQLADFSDRRAVVFGISADTVDSHRRFVQKYNLTFPLLADVEHRVAEQYGVWVEKNMYGRTAMGIARTTFIIDREGRIARIFRNVRPEGHEREVLAALRE